jgi:hypothetical protein
LGRREHKVLWHLQFEDLSATTGSRRAVSPIWARVKGKVESDVKYAKRNALPGRRFTLWEDNPPTGTTPPRRDPYLSRFGEVLARNLPSTRPLTRARGGNVRWSTPQVERWHEQWWCLRLYQIDPELTTRLEQAAKKKPSYAGFLDHIRHRRLQKLNTGDGLLRPRA